MPSFTQLRMREEGFFDMLMKGIVLDGCYLFRENAGRWWRAIEIKNGHEYAKWIVQGGGQHLDQEPYRSVGEWHGPIAADDPRFLKASADNNGCLLERDCPLQPTFTTPRIVEQAAARGWY